MSDDRDIPPDAGAAPPFDRDPTDTSEKAGAGDGYSGEEYDNAGQREWRDRQSANDVAPDGEVRGSGISDGGGNDLEEYDDDVATGGGDRPPEGN